MKPEIAQAKKNSNFFYFSIDTACKPHYIEVAKPEEPDKARTAGKAGSRTQTD